MTRINEVTTDQTNVTSHVTPFPASELTSEVTESVPTTNIDVSTTKGIYSTPVNDTLVTEPTVPSTEHYVNKSTDDSALDTTTQEPIKEISTVSNTMETGTSSSMKPRTMLYSTIEHSSTVFSVTELSITEPKLTFATTLVPRTMVDSTSTMVPSTTQSKNTFSTTLASSTKIDSTTEPSTTQPEATFSSSLVPGTKIASTKMDSTTEYSVADQNVQLTGKFKITVGVEWNDALADTKSTTYMELRDTLNHTVSSYSS